MSHYKLRPPPPALHGQGVAVDGGGVRLAGAARGSVAVGDGLVVALGAAGRGLHQVGGIGGGDGGQRDLWEGGGGGGTCGVHIMHCLPYVCGGS